MSSIASSTSNCPSSLLLQVLFCEKHAMFTKTLSGSYFTLKQTDHYAVSPSYLYSQEMNQPTDLISSVSQRKIPS
ncbi:hypothetical protein, partial [Pontibacterium sp.]|uniref:hypothetical protein n=1 Tax=Pontibacterium sp. TaxID=2036026 RepID=UPI0035686E01